MSYFDFNLVCNGNIMIDVLLFITGLRKAVGAMQKFREENINQRMEYLSHEKEKLNEFEIRPMLDQ